jgi:hypothetical protein
MKKIVIFLLVFAIPAFALSPSANNARTTFRNGYAWSGNPARDFATQWAQQVEAAAEIGSELGTGSIFYVDSNVASEGDGTSWSEARDTLDEAVGLCTADNGDFIMVAQGHNEALTAADAVDVDVAGVTVVGIGNGSLKPTFDYDNEAAEFVIGAANVKIENLRFRVSANAVTEAINIEAGGDSAEIFACEFGFAETTTDEFSTAINVVTGANDVTIDSCWFDAGAQAAITALRLGAISTPIINNNFISGDYSTATIWNDTTAVEVIITNNVIYNGHMLTDTGVNAVAVMTMANNTAGYVGDNRFITSAASAVTARGADDMLFMNNMMAHTDGNEYSGGLESSSNQITLTTALD